MNGKERYGYDMKIITLNRWEELFLDFIDMTEFYLYKEIDDNEEVYYRLEDGQYANLGDIQSDRFYSAASILDRMGIYEYDYIIEDLHECADFELKYDKWSDLLKYREQMPDNHFNFELIDMICNHAEDIDIDKVYNHLAA